MHQAPDFSVSVGNAGLTHYFSVAGRTMLFNAASGEFAAEVPAELRGLLERPAKSRAAAMAMAGALESCSAPVWSPTPSSDGSS